MKDTGRLRPALHEQLHNELLSLPFPAFQHLMQQLIHKSGYSHTQLVGRRHKRGRTRQGGHDLKAYNHTDLSQTLTATQIKQYRRVVSRRFVDELRGTMLRLGAEQGLLITTSTFSRVAYKAAVLSDVAPIRLIEGDEIIELLIKHRLGVCAGSGQRIVQRERADWQRLHVDTQFFEELREKYATAGTTPAHASARAAPSSRATRKDTNPSSEISATQPSNSAGTSGSPGGDMLWRTHVLIGLNSLWLLHLLPPGIEPEHLPLALGAAALASLLPDLDAAESKIKHLRVVGLKPFFLPAQAIHRDFGHRGFSHSLAALALLGVLILMAQATLPLLLPSLTPLLTWQVWLALLLGYASHLAADACTRSGIPLLYPRLKRYHLLPPGSRFTTGSEAEHALFPLLALGFLLLLLLQLRVSNAQLEP